MGWGGARGKVVQAGRQCLLCCCLPPGVRSHQRREGGRRPQELGVDVTPRLRVLAVEEPAKRKGGVILGSAAELVARLREEAKVI